MGYRYYRPETKAWEEVEPVDCSWTATYKDQKVVKQYADNGIFHQIREIDQSQLHRFDMVDSRTGKTHMLVFPEGATLIHGYIVSVFNSRTPREYKIYVFYFGYEVEGKKFIQLIMPDGNTILVDDLKKVVIG